MNGNIWRHQVHLEASSSTGQLLMRESTAQTSHDDDVAKQSKVLQISPPIICGLTIAVTHSATLDTWIAHVGRDSALEGSACNSKATAGSHHVVNAAASIRTPVVAIPVEEEGWLRAEETLAPSSCRPSQFGSDFHKQILSTEDEGLVCG